MFFQRKGVLTGLEKLKYASRQDQMSGIGCMLENGGCSKGRNGNGCTNAEGITSAFLCQIWRAGFANLGCIACAKAQILYNLFLVKLARVVFCLSKQGDVLWRIYFYNQFWRVFHCRIFAVGKISKMLQNFQGLVRGNRFVFLRM